MLKHAVLSVSLFVVMLTIAPCALAQQHVNAQCAQQNEEGHWSNTDPNTQSITMINLRFVCQDQVLNGQPYPPGPAWYVHIYGKCHPTDCDWGEVGATRLNTGHIYAFYDQGFAKRYVYARMSQYRPGQLWVYTWTAFTDPNRANYATQNWFRKFVV